MSCSESASIHELPELLDSTSINQLDCIREIFDDASGADLANLHDRVSRAQKPLRVVDVPHGGAIEIFSLDYNQDFFWALSFWLDERVHSASVRAIYKDSAQAAKNPMFKFRPEFFRSNADAVEFLKERHGLNEEAIVLELKQSGATLSVQRKVNGNSVVIYEVPPPDEIWNVVLFGDRARFVLTFSNDELTKISAKP